jgi:DNA polymerase-3 subunit delta
LTRSARDLHLADMAQDLTTLNARLQSEGPAPVYLVHGEERLLVDGAVRAILAAAVDDPSDAMSVSRFDLSEPQVDVRQVIDGCRSIGLFATRQVVLVRGAEAVAKRKGDGSLVLSYLEAPDPSTTLVLVAGQIDGRLSLVKMIAKVGEVLHYDSLKAREVPQWIVGEARRLGHNVDFPTANLIADLAGHKLGLLQLVVDQLSLYVGPGAPITRGDVEVSLAATREHSIFELVDAVGERRMVPAIGHLHAMLSHKEPPLRILAMLTRHFRQLWQVQEARALSKDVHTIQKELSLHQFVAKKLYAQCGRFDAVTLRRTYDRLYLTNLQLKSKGFDEALVMERLVMDLCTG